MQIASIDIETTGLDFEVDKILEVGIILFDSSVNTPVPELPQRRIIVPSESGRYDVCPFIMKMHAKLFEELGSVVPAGLKANKWYKKEDGTFVCNPAWLGATIKDFFFEQGYRNPVELICAGKNFASFDLQFLRSCLNHVSIKVSHRGFDPGQLFVLPTDDKIPNTEECCKRAGVTYSNKHTAIEDATMVIELLRVGLFNKGLS